MDGLEWVGWGWVEWGFVLGVSECVGEEVEGVLL